MLILKIQTTWKQAGIFHLSSHYQNRKFYIKGEL